MKTQLQFTIVFFTLSLTACHILQKDKLREKQQMQTEALQLEDRHQVLAQQSQWLLTDSSRNDLLLTIWPKGKFNYSLVNGFSGEAEKITLHARQRLQKSLQQMQTTKQGSVEIKANYASEKASTHNVQQHKVSARNNWAFVLLMLIAVMLIWLFRTRT